METTIVLYLLGGGIIVIVVPAILIRIYWDDFIEALHREYRAESAYHEQRQPAPRKNLPQQRLLTFQKGERNTDMVEDFFSQDYEMLWENRLN